MGDTSKPLAVVAIFILVVLAVVVRARALFVHRTRQRIRPRSGRILNASVDVVPLSVVHVQQANPGSEVAQLQRPQPPYHLGQMGSVTSLRYPPPAYHVHHLDPRLDGVAYGNTPISHNAGGPVDVVPAPLPPSYTQGGSQHL